MIAQEVHGPIGKHSRERELGHSLHDMERRPSMQSSILMETQVILQKLLQAMISTTFLVSLLVPVEVRPEASIFSSMVRQDTVNTVNLLISE